MEDTTQGTETSTGTGANGTAGENNEGAGNTEETASLATNTQEETIPPKTDGIVATDDEEPPVRKSDLEYILERKSRKIEKLKMALSKTTPPKETNSESTDDFSQEEMDKFRKMSEKIYGDKFKTVDQLAQRTVDDAVDNDVTTFFKQDPHADLLTEFEGKIRKYAQHPSRSQVPIDELVWGIAGKKLITLAAESVRKAQKAAAESRMGGNSARKTTVDSGKRDYAAMSSEDFAAHLARVQQGG